MKIRFRLGGFAALLIALMLWGTLFITGAAEEPQKSGLDIVFAIDVSGSVKTSDPSNMSKDAIVDALATAKAVNKAGDVKVAAVAYNHAVVWKSEKFTSDLAGLSSNIKALSAREDDGATDIPAGLLAATKMLDSIKDTTRRQYIVLFTDGKNESNRKDSKLKADLDAAIAKGYTVYVFGLNGDGSVNVAYLKNIAKRTGGKYQIMTKTVQLKQLITRLIEATGNGDTVIGPTGTGTFTGDWQELTINVENSGIVELYLLVDYEKNAKFAYQITDPDGKTYTKDSKDTPLIAVASNTSTSTRFSLFAPATGKWKFKIRGVKDKDYGWITIYDYNLTAELVYSAPDKNAGTNVTWKATLSDKGDPIDVAYFYEYFEAKLIMQDADKNKVETPMSLSGASYSVNAALPATPGDYTYIASIKSAKITRNTDAHKITVLAPVVEESSKLWLIILIAAVLAAAIAGELFYVKRSKTKSGPCAPSGSFTGSVTTAGDYTPLSPWYLNKGGSGLHEVPLSSAPGLSGFAELSELVITAERSGQVPTASLSYKDTEQGYEELGVEVNGTPLVRGGTCELEQFTTIKIYHSDGTETELRYSP
jgi:hypothetical protein